MIFNSQGDAKLRTYINGGSITPGPDPITLPKGGQLLGDLTIEAADTDAAYEEGYNSGYTAGYNAGYEEGQAVIPYSRELEYIQSSGSQYIDTGFKPNQNTRIVCDFQNMDTSALKWLLGVQPSWGVSMFDIALYANGTVHTGYGAKSATLSCSIGTTRQILDKNKNITSVGGVTSTLASQTFQATINAVLFAYNTNNGVSYFASARIYACKIYDNGTLVRDFIPVLDKSGVACMYDKVNKKFYYNAGSGSFSYA